MGSERPPSQEDAREWTAVGEQRGAARAGETMWSGPYLKPGERVVVVAKSRLEAAEAERAREQRLREAHYMTIQEERARADAAFSAQRAGEGEALRRVRESDPDQGYPTRPGHERAGEPPTPDEGERLRAALSELVRLKDLKDAAKAEEWKLVSVPVHPRITWTPDEKKSAWDEARAALDAARGENA